MAVTTHSNSSLMEVRILGDVTDADLREETVHHLVYRSRSYVSNHPAEHMCTTLTIIEIITMISIKSQNSFYFNSKRENKIKHRKLMTCCSNLIS